MRLELADTRRKMRIESLQESINRKNQTVTNLANTKIESNFKVFLGHFRAEHKEQTEN